MNKITEITAEMIEEFNKLLKSKNSFITVQASSLRSWDIVIKDDFVKSFIVNPTDEFYQLLEGHLLKYGVSQIKYNNTGSCFWKF